MQWDRDTMIGESMYEWMNVLSRMNFWWFQIYWLGSKSCVIMCPHLLLLDQVTQFSVICPKVTVIKSFSLRRLRIHLQGLLWGGIMLLHILLLGQVVQILSMLLEVFTSKHQSQILRSDCVSLIPRDQWSHPISIDAVQSEYEWDKDNPLKSDGGNLRPDWESQSRKGPDKSFEGEIMHDYGPFHSIVGLNKSIAALPHYSEAVG